MDRNVTLTAHRLEESDDGWLGIQWITKDLSPEKKMTVIFSRLNPDLKKVLVENAGAKGNVSSLKGKSFFTRIYRSGGNIDWKIDPSSVIPVIEDVPVNKIPATTVPTALSLALVKSDVMRMIKPVELKSVPKVVEAKPVPIVSEDKTKSGKRGADTKVLKMIRNNCETLIGREFFAQNRPDMHRKIIEIFNALNAELAK